MPLRSWPMAALAPVLLCVSFSLGYVPGDPPPEDFEPPPPYGPAESLAMIEVGEGIKVELAAAEPLVMDPVAFDWGPDGRLWVVEMRDYPLGMDGRGRPGGRVKVLEDEDGDGRYDRATLFLDEIPFPTGVKVWRDGVLVTAAPDVFYAQDTDGDGRADVRRTLFTGFGEGNQQHRVNGLRWGLDNWLHLANGDSGGGVRSLITGREVDIRGRDLRIRPDEGPEPLAEPQSGQTQFGRNRDDWGNWFGGDNSNPMWHYVLRDHYLRRNPHVASPRPWKHVSVDPGPSRVYPASDTLVRLNDPDRANRFTSACSPIIYRDRLLGEAFYGNSFVCEPVHNLVHREVVDSEGVSFTSRRPAEERQREFFASRDHWCRPVMVRTGPDGALWIADMYRLVIEHPEWIPEPWQAVMDLRAGDGMGRIYRVYREGRPPRAMPRLDRMSEAELAEALLSPNGPVRDMAHQMLLWRGEASDALVRRLEKMALSGVPPADPAATAPPASRVQALATLEGLGALSASIVKRAALDPDARVRRLALRLSERWLNESEEIGELVAALADDPDPKVRLQAAFSLGAWDDARAGRALGELLVRDVENEYITAAAVSSAMRHTAPMLAVILADAQRTPPGSLLEKLLATAVGAGDRGAVRAYLDHALGGNTAGDEARPMRLAALLLDAAGAGDTLDNLLEDDARRRLHELMDQARHVLQTEKGSTEQSRRVGMAAVLLLGRTPGRVEEDLNLLGGLLSPQTPLELQEAAVGRLSGMGGQEPAELMLGRWPQLGPRTQAAAFEALLSRGGWAMKLLELLERRPAAAAALGPTQRQRLLRHGWERVRQRAERVFGGSIHADRQRVIERYRGVGGLSGDPQRGREVFAAQCAACHRIGDVGNAVGPDLTALTDLSTGALLAAVFDPNRAVESKYVAYLVTTRDGRSRLGMIASETGNSVTLVGPDGRAEDLPRAQIATLASTGRSLMIEGLEGALSEQDVADVFAFIRRASGKEEE